MLKSHTYIQVVSLSNAREIPVKPFIGTAKLQTQICSSYKTEQANPFRLSMPDECDVFRVQSSGLHLRDRGFSTKSTGSMIYPWLMFDFGPPHKMPFFSRASALSTRARLGSAISLV